MNLSPYNCGGLYFLMAVMPENADAQNRIPPSPEIDPITKSIFSSSRDDSSASDVAAFS